MDPLLLRFLERLAVVLIGGMAIYLGYLLFSKVPEHRDSAGKVVLPWDVSIVMSRIGPGVFFALFGTIAVGLSLLRPMEIDSEATPGSSADLDVATFRYMGDQAPGSRNARHDARVALRKEIAALNTIPRQLRADLPEHDRYAIERSIARVKLLLIKPVWGDASEGFGDIAEFERWVNAQEPQPAPDGMSAALSLYQYGSNSPTP